MAYTFFLSFLIGAQAFGELLCPQVLSAHQQSASFFSKKIDFVSFYKARNRFSKSPDLDGVKYSELSVEEKIAFLEVLTQRNRFKVENWSDEQIKIVQTFIKKWDRSKKITASSLEELFFKLYVRQSFKLKNRIRFRNLFKKPGDIVSVFMKNFFYQRVYMKGLVETLIEMNIVPIEEGKKGPFKIIQDAFLLRLPLALSANFYALKEVGVPIDFPVSNLLSKARVYQDIDVLVYRASDHKELESAFWSFHEKYSARGVLDYSTRWLSKLSRLSAFSYVLITSLWTPLAVIGPDFILKSQEDLATEIVEIYNQEHLELRGVELSEEVQTFLLKSLVVEKSSLELAIELSTAN